MEGFHAPAAAFVTTFVSVCTGAKRLFGGRGTANFCSSPTHKRTEGRALVWGSEFTTKVATKVEFSRLCSWAK